MELESASETLLREARSNNAPAFEATECVVLAEAAATEPPLVKRTRREREAEAKAAARLELETKASAASEGVPRDWPRDSRAA